MRAQVAGKLDQRVGARARRQWRPQTRNPGRHEVIEIGPHDLEGHERTAQPFKPCQQRNSSVRAREGAKCGVVARRAGMQAQHGPRDDAQRALRANKQLLEVIARVVFQHFVQACDDGSIGKHHLEP